LSFLSSSIGKKYIMGLAGAGWTLFVLGHMAGNLLIFAGPKAFNSYGHAIVSNKPLLYGTEAFLIVCLLTHVILGILLSLQNKKAKPQKYAVSASPAKKSSLASSTMAIHGTIILIFIITHLFTFKFGTEYFIEHDGVMMRDLYRLTIEVFQQPLYMVAYIFCLFLLGFHLSHGTSSLFQSLGLNHPRYTPVIKKVGFMYAMIVTLGFMSQPIYVFFFM
jgi:succinate dehydrogenase / fumarate reductase cytochrome b subunit